MSWRLRETPGCRVLPIAYNDINSSSELPSQVCTLIVMQDAFERGEPALPNVGARDSNKAPILIEFARVYLLNNYFLDLQGFRIRTLAPRPF